MKKVTVIALLLVCLLPSLGKAKELVATSIQANQYSSEDEKQLWLIPSEVQIRDEDLSMVVGHGLESPSLGGFRRLELSDSRIKLWDEADGGVANIGNPLNLGTFQKITLSTR